MLYAREAKSDAIDWLFKCLVFLGELAVQATGGCHRPRESALFSSKSRPRWM